MAFYIRKSVKLGPVRFTLSKSGLGTSIGVRGFRVGVRPNGSSYLHAGRHGLYHRQELGQGSTTEDGQVAPPHGLGREQADDILVTRYDTASSRELQPQSRADLLEKLNDSYKSIRLDYMCAAAFLFIAIVGFRASSIAGFTVVGVGIFVTSLVGYREAKRRTVTLTYNFEDGDASHFQSVIAAFNHLASSARIWAVVDSQNISGTHASKLNAGAANLLNEEKVHVGSGSPPWVETNVTLPVLKTRGQTLYLMPDGLLVYDQSGVGFVEYRDVSLEADTTNFIRKQPPNDALVISSTWLHPNKNGGPDRRFADNYKIPVCLFGELRMESSSGMCFYLLTSKHDAPANFVAEFTPLIQQADSGATMTKLSDSEDLHLPAEEGEDWPSIDENWQAPTGNSGTVDGKHYTDFVERVKQLKRERRHDEAISLLLKLVDATESESREAGRGLGVAPWYYEQLAIIYRKEKRYADEVSILERYATQPKAPGVGPAKLAARLEKASALCGSQPAGSSQPEIGADAKADEMIARLSPEAQRIVREMPDGWNLKLLCQVWKDELGESKNLLEHYSERPTEWLAHDDVEWWLTRRKTELDRIQTSFTELMQEDIYSTCVTESSARVRTILFVARNVGKLYRETIAWDANVCAIAGEKPIGSVAAALSSMAEEVLNIFETYPADLGEAIKEIEESLARGEGLAPRAVPVTLVNTDAQFDKVLTSFHM